jgi:hypothetical protein
MAGLQTDGLMQWSMEHRNKLMQWYAIGFTAIISYRWWHNMLLYQMDPQFFVNRMDMTTWLLMSTGLHKAFLQHRWLLGAMDVLLLLLPVSYFRLQQKGHRWQYALGWTILLFNFVYFQIYTLYPTTSIEGYIGLMAMPLLFTCRSNQRFFFTYHFLRFLFLYFFASAGFWKLKAGGFFNLEQMSATLLNHHAAYMVTSPDAWLTKLYTWLASNKTIAWGLYAAATVFELSFLIGFFTRRFDKILLILFVIFLCMDWLIMRIPYFEMGIMLLTLWWSHLLPEKTANDSPTNSQAANG